MYVQTSENVIINMSTGDIYRRGRDQDGNYITLNGHSVAYPHDVDRVNAFWSYLLSLAVDAITLANNDE